MRDGNDHGTNSAAQCPQICHCEAPKGPRQSREGSCDFAEAALLSDWALRDSHVASLLRNDNSGGIHHFNDAVYRLLVLTRRSLTAATDAIGACCFNGGLYNLRVPSRDCHVASLLAMTNLKASCRRIIVPILAVANGAQGTPYRRQLVCAFYRCPVRAANA